MSIIERQHITAIQEGDVMKKLFSPILFVVSAAVLLFGICFCIYGLEDIHKTLAAPGTSGIDYFGLGWGCGIGLFIISIFGLVLSTVNIKISESKMIRYGLLVMITLFVVLLLTAIIIFFI